MAQPAARVRILLPLCILFLISTAPAFAQTIDDPYVASELILSFAAEADGQQRQGVLDQLGATNIVQFNRIDGGLYRLDSMSVEEALAVVEGNPYLALAEPNYIVYEHAVPDDPRFDELWGMENTGQTGGTPGADISATDAWNIFTGSRNVVVGVIDTGVDISHPDIADNVFINEGEIPGNGIDDDGNGFIDDVSGWDFANNDNNPFDDAGHGTHVAGTIGGVGNNGVGVAGVNWSVRILPIKFLGASGGGTTAAAVQAVEYATLMGVDLTNNSWGGGGFSTALLAAIEDADAAGIHFVASAGNSGRNTDFTPSYPASYDTPNIISVAATDHNDQLASFSNYGAVSVDLGAPGVSILSTVPGGGYTTADGTSMAAPHVAGVVAMMVGRFPLAPHDALKQRLLTTADPISALDGITVSGARLNAFMAIADPDETPPAPVTDLAVVESGSNWLRVAWTATGDDGSEGTAVTYEMRRAEYPLDETNFETGILVEGLSPPLPSGQPEEHVVDGLDFLTTYWVAVVARDEFGNTSLVSNSPSGVTLGIPIAAVSPASLSDALLTGATSTQPLLLSNTGEGTLDFVFGPVEYLDVPATSAVATDPGQSIETYLAHYEAIPPLASAPGIDGAVAPDDFFGKSPSSVERDYFDYLHSTVDGAVIYTDDMESGAPGWTHAPTSGSVDQWALGTARSASGSFAWNVSQHSYEGADALSSPPIDLPALPELRLTFQHWYNFDDCGGDTTFEPDGGIVEVSTDDGITWNQIFPLGGYPYVLDDICGNPLAYFEAYSHDGGDGTAFIPAVFDLSEFGGSTIRIRFHAGWDCGNCGMNEGWYVDDVTVFADVPPWLGVDLVAGTLGAGETAEVGVTFNALGLFGGLHTANLVIGSNDPVTPELSVPVDLMVTGAPDIAVTPSVLDFGTVFVDGSEQRTLLVENVGTAVLTVSDISIDHPDFTLSATSAVLGFGEGIAVDVNYAPTAVGPVQPTITILSDDPDEASFVVPVSAAGVDPPIIVVSPASIDVDLFTGEAANRIVTVRNDGSADLELEVAAAATGGPAATEPQTGALERFGPAFSAVTATIQDPFSADQASGIAEPGPKRDQEDQTASTLAGAGLSVLFIHAGDVSQIQGLLLAFPEIDVVDALDGGSSTPTLEDLLAYDSVILAPNSQLADKPLLGDILADYVDLGGGVIETTPAFVDGRSVEGRWLAEGYSPYELGVGPVGMADLAGFDPSHPIMQGVTSATVDLTGTAVLRPDATWVADLTNGEGFVATNDRRVVAVNVFLAASGYWSGDIPLLLRNAVLYSAGGLSWLSVEPTTAVIPAGQTVDLDLAFDAARLNGGVYSAVVELTSNDPVQPLFNVPVTLSVTGAPDIVVDPLALDFGELFVGDTAALGFTVENVGTDLLTVNSIVSSDPDITVSATGLVLAVGDVVALDVDWAPSAAGPLAATVTLLSDDPDEPSTEVSLAGMGLDPPDIAVNPTSLTSDLFTGDIEQQTLTISNEGVADLEFALGTQQRSNTLPRSENPPPLSSERSYELAEGAAAVINGSTEHASATGLERVYGTDPSILVYTDNTLFARGNNVAEQALQRMGLAYTVEYVSPDNFIQLLSGGTWDLVIVDNSLRLMDWAPVEAYVTAGGALIVSFWDIDGSVGGPSTLWPLLGVDVVQDLFTTPPIYRWDVSHPLFTQPNEVPDLLIRLDTVNDNGDKFNTSPEMLAGYSRPVVPGEGAMLISPDYRAIVHGFLPGENPVDLDSDSIPDAVELYENEIEHLLRGANWLSVEPDSGVLASGESIDLSVGFDATGLFGGTYEADIIVTSNDPDESEVTVPVTLTVTGIPLIAVQPTSLDFDWLYLTQDRTVQLTVSNPGSETLVVTELVSDDGQFTTDLTAFTVEPLQEQIVNVTFLAATPGAIEASLTLSHNAGEGATVVSMTATAVVPPEIAVNTTLAEAAAMPAGQKVKTLTVCNEGGSDLNFSVGDPADEDSGQVYTELILPKQSDEEGSEDPVDPRPGILGTGGPDAFGYTWDDSDEPGGPVFEWVDITAVGTPVPFPSYVDDGNVGPFPIGFEFPFYDNTFNELYACSNGWLSFTSRRTTYSNQPLPNSGASVPENLLAAWWDDMAYDERYDNYAYYYNDGSRFIITYHVRRLGSATPPFYEFQVILYPNGHIVYQYNGMGVTRGSSTIGIQNGTKDVGLAVVHNDGSYIHDGMAIEFKPIPEWLTVEPTSGVVPPGECVDLTLTFDASGLEVGDYTGDITLNSNDITDPTLAVPVLFHVGTVDAADADADPNTLNVAANGKWMTVYVELPPEYDPARVLVETVKINGEVPAETSPFANDEDFNGNGIPDLMFKFDRTALSGVMTAGEAVELTITGEVEDTTWFVTTDHVRVINPTMKAPNGGEILAAGYQYPLIWDLPAEWEATHSDVFWTPDEGETWLEIATNVPGNSLTWNLPADMTTETALVRVFVYDEQGLLGYDSSDAVFEITGQFTDAPSSTRPRSFALLQNSPNPFNPRTEINFDLPRDENVNISVYDVKGRLVRTLLSEPMTYGSHKVVWEGEDNHGNRVATGVYYYRIVAGSFTATKSMVLVK